MIKIFVAHIFLVCLLEHCEIGFIVENGVTEKKSECSMTVMLLKIMKSLNISSAVCCCLGKSSWSILFWNTISYKAPMELKKISVIRTFRMNFSIKSWNYVLHASLLGTRKRIHQWFLISPFISQIDIHHVNYHCGIELSCYDWIIHNDQNSFFSTTSKTNMK